MRKLPRTSNAAGTILTDGAAAVALACSRTKAHPQCACARDFCPLAGLGTGAVARTAPAATTRPALSSRRASRRRSAQTRSLRRTVCTVGTTKRKASSTRPCHAARACRRACRSRRCCTTRACWAANSGARTQQRRAALSVSLATTARVRGVMWRGAATELLTTKDVHHTSVCRQIHCATCQAEGVPGGLAAAGWCSLLCPRDCATASGSDV